MALLAGTPDFTVRVGFRLAVGRRAAVGVAVRSRSGIPPATTPTAGLASAMASPARRRAFSTKPSSLAARLSAVNVAARVSTSQSACWIRLRET